MLAAFALDADLVPAVALAGALGLRRAPGGPAAAPRRDLGQRDAVHRADRDAEFATGAVRVDDVMHQLVAADDRVDRTGLDAERAADAPVLVDDREPARTLEPVLGVERQRLAGGEGGQSRDALGAAGRTLVDGGLAARDRMRVGMAIGIAAARALRLRQGLVQAFDERVEGGVRHSGGRGGGRVSGGGVGRGGVHSVGLRGRRVAGRGARLAAAGWCNGAASYLAMKSRITG